MTLRFLLALALSSCTPAVNPPNPDASDAAPAPPLTEAAPEPTVPCAAACEAMARLCGPQLPNCVQTQAHIESAREVRESNGHPQTCYDVSQATTVAAMRALGVHCGI
jgi:hypothetical protein